MSDGYPTPEQEEEIAKIEAMPVVVELRSQLKFAHAELGRWRDDYARLTHLRQHLSKENRALKRIAALCKDTSLFHLECPTCADQNSFASFVPDCYLEEFKSGPS